MHREREREGGENTKYKLSETGNQSITAFTILVANVGQVNMDYFNAIAG